MKEIKIPFDLTEYKKSGYELKYGKIDPKSLCTEIVNNEGEIVYTVKSFVGDATFMHIFNKDGKLLDFLQRVDEAFDRPNKKLPR